jgi:hypothetical protein
MRFADNFNPEWGYLAPAPNFMRTARVALVAAAVGAISGAGVVLSLIDRPAAEETSIAARTLVRQTNSVLAAVPVSGQLQGPHEIGAATDHVNSPLASVESKAEPSSALGGPATAFALTDAPVAAAVPGDTTSLPKKAMKRQPLLQQHLTWRAPRDQTYDAGREPAFSGARTPLALLPNGSYLMRGQYSGAYQARDDF